MLGVPIKIGTFCDFDYFPQIHHHYTVTDVLNHGKIMGDKKERQPQTLLKFVQKIDDLCLYRNVEGRDRFVTHNEFRFKNQRARDSDAFLAEASAALGHPVEVIYGAEEARLIYGGVIQDLGNDHPRRLVIDIGGGSTEVIVGELARPELVESLSLGAVVQMQRFFGNGKITRKAWQAAVTDARLTVEPIARAYRRAGWDLAIGASGSVKSILRAAGATKADETITPADLKALARAVLKAGKVDKLDLPGVSEERRAIFPGGLAVLTGLFESLGIEAMRVSDKALREKIKTILVRQDDHVA